MKYWNMNGTPWKTRAPTVPGVGRQVLGHERFAQHHRRSLQQHRHDQIAERVRVGQRDHRDWRSSGAMPMASMM